MSKRKLDYSHISCKNVRVGKASITDPPVLVHVYPIIKSNTNSEYNSNSLCGAVHLCVLQLFVVYVSSICKFSIKAVCADKNWLCRTLTFALDNRKQK
jgi:hypothetical protein